MDPSKTLQLVTIFILLLLSAFFSSAETAFTTVNRIRIRSLVEEGNKHALKVSKIIDNSSKMLSALLIGNNIVNISASALATTFVTNTLGSKAVGVSTGVLTLLVLIFGEITPKTAATIYAEKIALSYANFVYAIMTIFTPVIFIVDKLASAVMLILGMDKTKKVSLITETELRTLVEVSHEEGVIESEEKRIINNLFDFGDAQAKDIMIPRIDMTFANVTSNYDDIVAIFRSEKYTRIPIYEDTIDNVIGIVNVKDLLLYDSSEDFNIRDILRTPYYTYEYKNVADLMSELRKTSNNITIVIDEYGSTVGMITLEDLLEEIVGEIRDEYDEDEHDSIQKLNDTEYLLDGSAKLDDLNELLNMHFKSEDNDSIGGYIIEKLDRLPVTGDSISEETYTIYVKSVTKNRIESVLLTLLNPTDTDSVSDPLTAENAAPDTM